MTKGKASNGNQKDWERYEALVREVLEELSLASGVRVFPKRTYRARASGRSVEVDVSFELDVVGARALGLVECKYWKSKVKADTVMAFSRLVHAVGAQIGIIVTTKGFQDGAKKEAKATGVSLAVLDPLGSDGLNYIVRGKSDGQAGSLPHVLQGEMRMGDWPSSRTKSTGFGLAFASPQEFVELIRIGMSAAEYPGRDD